MSASIVVMGVSGSGKTRIGRALARALGAAFLEGDRFHPAENIAKMRSGQPLTDADRAPWLAALNAALQEHAARGQRAVLACSALKQNYREQLGQGGLPLHFVYLKGTPALIARRVQGRKRHFMPVSLLDSQFDALEEPANAIIVDAAQSVGRTVRQILAALGEDTSKD
ncbi:MAG: gluconokinase [Anaerolineales bacterium]|nr:MAG: gluconokinase [Anaerolineales bacterium]